MPSVGPAVRPTGLPVSMARVGDPAGVARSRQAFSLGNRGGGWHAPGSLLYSIRGGHNRGVGSGPHKWSLDLVGFLDALRSPGPARRDEGAREGGGPGTER